MRGLYPLKSSGSPAVVVSRGSGVQLHPASRSLLATQQSDNSQRLWDYVQPYLIRHKRTVPTTDFVKELLEMPRVREVELNLRSTSRPIFIDNQPAAVAAILIQLTGEFPEKTCTCCTSAPAGPFATCIVIDRNANEQARARYLGCANCIYRGSDSRCNLRWQLQHRIQPSIPEAARDQTSRDVIDLSLTDDTPTSTPTTTTFWSVRPAPSTAPVGPSTGQAPSRTASVPSRASPAPSSAAASPAWNVPGQSTATTGASSKRKAAGECDGDDDEARSAAPGARAASRAASVSVTGNPAPSEAIEMEDWEVAPGHVHETVGQDAESTSLTSCPPPRDASNRGGRADRACLRLLTGIAFSKAFFTAGRKAVIAQDVTFRVETIRAGSVLRFEAEAGNSRLCSVAAGKLRVRVGEEPEFVIGPQGAFKIKPGLAGSATNRLYVDAVLHVTTVPDAY